MDESLCETESATPGLDLLRRLVARGEGPGGERHVVVFDTEYTAWEGSLARGWSEPWEYREMVQIGAVKLRLTPGLPEVASFDRLTRPVFNPELSDYFTALTGITNEALAARGGDYAAGLAAFAEFTADCSHVFSNGGDDVHLSENCGWRSVSWPFRDGLFVNLRRDFCAALEVTPDVARSCDLPGLFGLPFAGPAHDGVGDSRAIAAALRHLVG